MRVALKEWAVVCEALAAGRQIFLLRKGGIAEGRRGFELAHERFVFFPTWEHQQRDWVQSRERELFDHLQPSDPEHVVIRYGAEVDEIRQAPADVNELLAARDLHVWEEPYLRKRYEYRPDLPLYVVFVRAFSLAAAERIPNDRRYKGCRSWVDLYDGVDATGASNVLSPERYREQKGLLVEQVDLPQP